jgi:hypothetical protein
MSEEAFIREAMQRQATLLQREFPNLEELRSVIHPTFNKKQKRPEVWFKTPQGPLCVWWDGTQWNARFSDGLEVQIAAKRLLASLKELERLREDTIAHRMEVQASRLRSEFGDLEELLGWARPVYNYEDQQPEVRFDTPIGICRFWWEKNRWIIRLPEGSNQYAPLGDLRAKVTQARQFLRKGII